MIVGREAVKGGEEGSQEGEEGGQGIQGMRSFPSAPSHFPPRLAFLFALSTRCLDSSLVALLVVLLLRAKGPLVGFRQPPACTCNLPLSPSPRFVRPTGAARHGQASAITLLFQRYEIGQQARTTAKDIINLEIPKHCPTDVLPPFLPQNCAPPHHCSTDVHPATPFEGDRPCPRKSSPLCPGVSPLRM